MKCSHVVGALLLALLATAAQPEPASFDVLVYGSTPGGIMAAVAAARHGARTALLSQRAHVGGVCAGGLGQSDVGSCTEVIGGLALEFFQASAAEYATPQPRAPWNLEPHVAQRVFLRMLNESGVVMLSPAQVLAVGVDSGAAERTLGAIRLGARSEEGLARPQERRRRDRLERVRRLRRVVGMQHLLRRARPEAWNGAGGGCARTRTSARSTVL